MKNQTFWLGFEKQAADFSIGNLLFGWAKNVPGIRQTLADTGKKVGDASEDLRHATKVLSESMTQTSQGVNTAADEVKQVAKRVGELIGAGVSKKNTALALLGGSTLLGLGAGFGTTVGKRLGSVEIPNPKKKK